MHDLLLKSQKKVDSISIKFKRYLYQEINLINKLSSIQGARGVGKTTLLLQLARVLGRVTKYCMLLSMIYFLQIIHFMV